MYNKLITTMHNILTGYWIILRPCCCPVIMNKLMSMHMLCLHRGLTCRFVLGCIHPFCGFEETGIYNVKINSYYIYIYRRLISIDLLKK